MKIGFIPAIVKVFLLRKLGEAKAKELILTGDLILADEAQKMGLINYVVSGEDLEKTVSKFAQKLIAENSEQSMALTKEMIANVQSMTLENGLQYAAEMNAHARTTADCKKGIASFLTKEKLSW